MANPGIEDLLFQLIKVLNFNISENKTFLLINDKTFELCQTFNYNLFPLNFTKEIKN